MNPEERERIEHLTRAAEHLKSIEIYLSDRTRRVLSQIIRTKKPETIEEAYEIREAFEQLEGIADDYDALILLRDLATQAEDKNEFLLYIEGMESLELFKKGYVLRYLMSGPMKEKALELNVIRRKAT